MSYYVPGTEEKDQAKVIMSLQQAHEKTADNTTDIATNTADIATRVIGPASATDNALARFDGTTGKTVQNSEITLGDSDGKLTRTAGISVSGTNTNDSAASGYFGEFSSATATTGTLTTNVATNITSIALGAGDWDITAGFTAGGTGGPTVTEVFVSINTASATANTTAGQCYRIRGFSLSDPLLYGAVGTLRASLTGSTTYYLNTTCQYTGGTFAVSGIIRARRVR
jgi:hypothetical protein